MFSQAFFIKILYLNNNTKNSKINKKYLDKVRKMRIMKVS